VRPSGGISDEAWKADVRLLIEMHAKLKRIVGELSPRDLSIIAAGSKVRNIDLLTGIAADDLYHAGQIQLFKRLHSGDRKLPV